MRKKQPDADEADYADRTDPLRNNPSGVPPPGQETATTKGQEQLPKATATAFGNTVGKLHVQ